MRYIWPLAFLLTLLASVAHAQSTGASSTARREDPLQRKLQSVVRLELLEAAMRPPAPSNRDRTLVLAQIREDFSRIQLVNDDLIDAMSGKTAFDPRTIARAASEIKRRAKRLKQNLVLPSPPKDADASSETIAPDLRPYISRLSKLIESFVSNPMLSQRHVVDATLSLQASRDLEDMIGLSGKLKKAAEKTESR